MPFTYKHSVDNTEPHQLRRLHADWPNPPSPERFHTSLSNMNAVVIAIDEDTGDVVGFICGMTDNVMILYIWDLEVLAEYRELGVEGMLLDLLLEKYGHLYQVNANPHPGILSVFSEAGFTVLTESQCLPVTKMDVKRQNACA